MTKYNCSLFCAPYYIFVIPAIWQACADSLLAAKREEYLGLPCPQIVVVRKEFSLINS